MEFTGQGGIRVYRAGQNVLVTPDEQVTNIQSGPQPIFKSTNPLSTLYFFASLDGANVNVTPGMLQFEVLYGVGLGIPVNGGGAGVPFVVSGMTATTSGFIYYEAAIETTQAVATTSQVTSAPPTHIGSSDYYFSLSAYANAVTFGAGFTNGQMLYATSRPASAAGYYRKVLATVSIDDDGNPFNLKQECCGMLTIPRAEVMIFLNFGETVA